MTVWNPVKRSAFYHEHLALGASLEERDGWLQPARYSSVEQEMELLSLDAGFCDISPVGKISIQGEELDHLLGPVFPGAMDLDIGSLRQMTVTSGSGSSNVVLARLAVDEFLALTSAESKSALVELLVENPDQCAHVVDLTSALAGVRVAGPSAGPLLASLTELDLSDAALPDLRCAQSRVTELQGTLLRMDVAELPCYELYVSREFGQYFWEVLMEAAAWYKAAPVGFEAMERLEA